MILLKINPAGRVGLTVNVSGVTPPEDVTGINAVAATFCVSTEVADSRIALNANGALIVKLNVLLLVCDSVSVTVTV